MEAFTATPDCEKQQVDKKMKTINALICGVILLIQKNSAVPFSFMIGQ
jgi:hypothetical protein